MTIATIKTCLANRSAALLSLLCSVACQTVFAQTNDSPTPQWYQVEVVIFERANEQYINDNSEEWPKNIIFGYPKDTVHLLNNDELLAKLEQEQFTNDANSNADDNLDNTPDNTPDNNNLDNNLGTYNNTDNQPADLNIDTPINAEQPFVLLDKSERELNIDTQRINRKNNLRVLFHEAWRQPLEAKQASTNVLILGGNEYDGHHELEGTLNLRVNRYLHVSTNLWFNRFAANYGQESLHWPPLPDVPQDLPSENDNAITTAGESFSQDYGISPGQERRNTYSDNTNSTDINYAFSANNNQNATQWGLTPESNPYWQSTETFTKSEPSAYLVEEIILMQQNRRMRSEELHYIDHPRMGITIKITPYELADTTDSM